MQSDFFFFFSCLTFWVFLYNKSRFHEGTKQRFVPLILVRKLLTHPLHLSFTLTVSFSWQFHLLNFLPPKKYFIFPASARLLKASVEGLWSCQGAPSCQAVFIAALCQKGNTEPPRDPSVMAPTMQTSQRFGGLCPCRVSMTGTACDSCS